MTRSATDTKILDCLASTCSDLFPLRVTLLHGLMFDLEHPALYIRSTEDWQTLLGDLYDYRKTHTIPAYQAQAFDVLLKVAIQQHPTLCPESMKKLLDMPDVSSIPEVFEKTS